MRDRVILDLCGGTGSWSKPYKEAGYSVKIITLPENDVTDEKTVQFCLSLKPYGILCASPCECWGLMGNCRWKERTVDHIFLHAKILVKNLRIIYESNPNFWCIENPPGKMKDFLGSPRFSFNPNEYGENYSKKTYLWGKFNTPNPPLFGESKITQRDYIRQGRGKNKSELRAITPAGFAKAFFEANR